MKRREFMRSLGGAVAAVMLPFVAPLPKVRSFYDELLEQMERIKRHRQPPTDRIDVFTDAATAAKMKTLYALYLQGTFQ